MNTEQYTNKDDATSLALSAAITTATLGVIVPAILLTHKPVEDTAKVIFSSIFENAPVIDNASIINIMSDFGIAAVIFGTASAAIYKMTSHLTKGAYTGHSFKVNPKAALIGAATGIAMGTSLLLAYNANSNVNKPSPAPQIQQTVKAISNTDK